MAANRSCQTSRVSGPSDKACLLASIVMLTEALSGLTDYHGSPGWHSSSFQHYIKHQGDRHPTVFYIKFL